MNIGIRQGHLADLPYLYEICQLTGFQGGSAEGQIADHFLLGQLFAAPYLVCDSTWTWIAHLPDGIPRGYLVATPDSRTFADFMNQQWLPVLGRLYPTVIGAEPSKFEAIFRKIIHSPATFPDFVDIYPAHLHIDILPIGQGQGLGRRLVEIFIDQLRKRGIKGFHLGMAEGNLSAGEFYKRLGLRVIERKPGVLYWGMEV